MGNIEACQIKGPLGSEPNGSDLAPYALSATAERCTPGPVPQHRPLSLGVPRSAEVLPRLCRAPSGVPSPRSAWHDVAHDAQDRWGLADELGYLLIVRGGRSF